MAQPRTVLVTGGSLGIGLGIAKRFHRDGFRVAIAGRDKARLEAAARELGDSALTYAGDVGERVQVERMMSGLIGTVGKLDVLVNCAGIMPRLYIETPMDEAEKMWDDTIRINLKGTFLVSRLAAPHLTSPGGRIINISSIVAQSGGSVAGFMSYTASKGGVSALTMALARELAPRDITVNAVSPGMIEETGMTGTFDEATSARIRGAVALGRPGRIDDIAGAVAWLASPDASYVTGVNVPVNGGWRFGN